MDNTGSSLDVLLMEAFHSYRQGLLRLPPSPFPLRDLSTLVFLNNIERMRFEERAELHRLEFACKEGLAAARQGRLEVASDHFQQAQAYLDTMQNGERLAWLFGVSTYQAGIAYWYYKHGSSGESRKRLEWAMDADLELELSGLPVLQMRRIQHGHNLARMDFRLNRRSVAIELVGDLVAYMEGQIENLSYHHDWRPRSLREVPRSTVRFMAHEVVSETVGRIITGGASEEEWSILIGASRLCQNPDAAIFPQAQYALLAQAKRLANKQEDYLYNLNQFFRIGIRHCHLLWYSVLTEFANFCSEMDTRCSRQIREVIERDSSKWKGIPSFLLDRLIGMDAQRKSAFYVGDTP